MMSAVIGTLFFGLLVVCGFAFYFLPALIALGRKHRNTASIFILNLLLGWTLLFWVVALVWAFSAQAKEPPKTDPKKNAYRDELKASIVAAESKIDGVVADQIVTAQGLEEWLRARGWHRDYEKFGNLDWHSPRAGASKAATSGS